MWGEDPEKIEIVSGEGGVVWDLEEEVFWVTGRVSEDGRDLFQVWEGLEIGQESH